MRPVGRPGRGSSSVLLAALLAACAGDGDGTDRDAPETPVEATEAEAEAAPPTGSEVPALRTDSTPALRTYRLLLVNPRPIQTLVYADAGAGRVLLDTVPRVDSVRVNVEVRAARLRLTVTDRWGERLAASSIDLRPDSLQRWEVPNGTGSAVDGGQRSPRGDSAGRAPGGR